MLPAKQFGLYINVVETKFVLFHYDNAAVSVDGHLLEVVREFRYWVY